MAITALTAWTFVAAVPESSGSAPAWSAPIGIPVPTFGLAEVAPNPPDPWTTATPGFYYVNATDRAATDERNELGTPKRPRRTIPIVLPAGAVVELHGAYDVNHGSPNTIIARGTAGRPVFIRGHGAAERPLIRNGWEVKGTYFVLENLEFGPRDEKQVGFLVVRSPTRFAAVRDCELRGNKTGGGLGVVSWHDVETTEQVVVLRNRIHDNGDVHADFDQDVHGISVGSRVNHLWIVDNEIARNSGDGLQINPGAGQNATTHHIYVGRNVTHHNKQTGLWVKLATDIIFSQNLSYGHRPGNSSVGQCIGGQYGPDWVWFIYNHLHDCEYGVALMSDGDDGARQTHMFVIGNVIHNIHRTTLKNDPNDAWGPAGVLMAGGFYRSVVNNTIVDVDSGINVPSPFGTLEVVNNIIAAVTLPGAAHLNVGFEKLAAATRVHHDILFGSPRASFANPPRPIDAKGLKATSSSAANPGFADVVGDDFHLRPDSPAGGRGALSAVYSTFAERYHVSIAVDADGRPRSDPPSIGAFEPPDAGGVTPRRD
jgi:hypothetical protein